jgi:hypothetical protein
MTLTNIVIKQNPHECRGLACLLQKPTNLQLYPMTVTRMSPPPNAASEILIELSVSTV